MAGEGAGRTARRKDDDSFNLRTKNLRTLGDHRPTALPLLERSSLAGEEGGLPGRWCVRPRKDDDSSDLRTKQLRTLGDKRPLALREGRYGRSRHHRCHDQRHLQNQKCAPHKLNLLSSMSRILWVWFLCYLKSVHREVAPERPLLAAPQGYLRCKRARARLVGEDPYHPRPPLYLLEQALQHVGRA